MQFSMPKGPLVCGVRQLWPNINQLTSNTEWRRLVALRSANPRYSRRKIFGCFNSNNLLGSRKHTRRIGDDVRFREWSLGALDGSQISRNGDVSGRRRITVPAIVDELEELKSDPVDAILVLAGGQLPGGGVPVWVERRLDKALQLQKLSGHECCIVCLGNGTPHRPPLLTSEGFVIHESTSCAEYLISEGAPVRVLIKECSSYDTIGNGFFALTQHAIPQRWKKMAIVTSAFHMPRSQAIFEWVFGLQGAGTSLQDGNEPTNGSLVPPAGSRSQGFILQYHSVSDDGIDRSIIEARIAKERRALESLKIVSAGINTLSDFHVWFHSQHSCYNVRDQGLFGKQTLNDPALRSY